MIWRPRAVAVLVEPGFRDTQRPARNRDRDVQVGCGDLHLLELVEVGGRALRRRPPGNGGKHRRGGDAKGCVYFFHGVITTHVTHISN